MLKEIIEAYGFVDLGIQKNPYMYSYKKGETRINYYHTTGTVTVQKEFGSCKTYRDIHTDEQMEKILITI